ncbi:MAG: hypothetical protein ACRD3T_02700 [Terriglobia bacterium]
MALVHLQNGSFKNWSGAHQGESFEYYLLVLMITLAVMACGSGAVSLDRALAGDQNMNSPLRGNRFLIFFCHLGRVPAEDSDFQLEGAPTSHTNRGLGQATGDGEVLVEAGTDRGASCKDCGHEAGDFPSAWTVTEHRPE